MKFAAPVPEDFDEMGRGGIERLFGGDSEKDLREINPSDIEPPSSEN